ncbi:hypothetical protein CCACVL1_29970 [Corchorus capsularis]|uniref:Uncharacterized protein n=1 Tax=Corchorus capsularis TaxID=210143 RepID=A0A1R3FZ96_COCAP|nr:hypothetical protein CCACVL1_29970 [Corchorus capsularis]
MSRAHYWTSLRGSPSSSSTASRFKRQCCRCRVRAVVGLVSTGGAEEVAEANF